MEKTLKDILTLICGKFQYSYEISAAGELSLQYGPGSAKLLIDNSYKGLKLFINALETHKNKIAGKVSKFFLNTVSEPEPELSKEYKITKNKFWFDASTSILYDQNNIDFTNEETASGFEVLINAFPDYLFLWHPGTGFDISIVYKNILFGTQLYKGTGEEIIKSFINEITALGSDFIANLEAAIMEEETPALIENLEN